MSFLKCFDRKRSYPHAIKIAEISAFPFLYPRAGVRRRSYTGQSPNLSRRCRGTAPQSPEHVENIFVAAIIRAGRCQKHAHHTKASAKPSSIGESRSKHQRRNRIALHEQTRGIQAGAPTKGAAGEAATVAPEITREEFGAIVNPYPSFRDLSLKSSVPKDHPSADLLSNPLGPFDAAPPLKQEIEEEKDLVIVEDIKGGEESSGNHGHAQWDTVDLENALTIEKIKSLLKDPFGSHQELYTLYQSLPPPRAPYLDSKTLGKLLHHLAVVPRRTEARMLRYLSILDDLKASNIPISRSNYTSAIAFVGQAFSPITQESVASAIRIYRTMEAESQAESTGAKSSSLATHVTFTALFDIAAKSQRFAVAELIAKEMSSRNLEPSRYFRVSRILYEGLRGDGKGVRRAYQALVDSGEIVDTVAINCVMSSLLRVGEISDAEMVFERMKRVDREKRELIAERGGQGVMAPPFGWRRKRDLAKLLARAGGQLRNNSAARNKIQDASPIAPDSHSYSLFLRYHAHTAGNIDRVRELLDEMDAYDLPIDNRIYVILFRGFAFHGGVRYTSWKKDRLENIWEDFLIAEEKDSADWGQESKDEDGDAICFDPSLAWAVLSAYAQCATQQRTMEVWEQIKDRWKPDFNDSERLNRRLAIRLSRPTM